MGSFEKAGEYLPKKCCKVVLTSATLPEELKITLGQPGYKKYLE